MNKLASVASWLVAITLAWVIAPAAALAAKPNVVLVVADDMGWRDTGYHGNTVVKTPHLDDMASRGLRFDYFYPGQQMCSPGRFAIMTGRNPFRTGLHHLGAMRKEEITLAKALKTAGYHTAHFGKWHLGQAETMPSKMGFDRAVWKINYFDLGATLQVNDTKETVELVGDTSVATMGLALDWIRGKAKEKEPFFVQVCFGSPHSPHRASDEFSKLYADLPEKKQNFLGEVSGVDAAVGNLRAELMKLGLAENTILWFTSDNGGITPESQDPAGKGKMNVGVRTQGLVEWPARIKSPMTTTLPCGHVDIYPTILEVVGVTMPNQPPLDGISLLPLIDGKLSERGKPLGFMLWNGKGKFEEIDFTKAPQGVLIDGPHKLIVAPEQEGKPREVRLYHIHNDPAEKSDLAEKHPEIVARMRQSLEVWQKSVRDSFDGKDFVAKK